MLSEICCTERRVENISAEDRERKSLKSAPSAEFEKMLSKLLATGGETVKEVERVIQSPDSETKITYEVQVDPLTGKQRVTEKFTTSKRECAICNGYFAHVLTCGDCGAQVCASDSRRASWVTWVGADFEADEIGTPINHEQTVCRSCALTRGIKD